MKHHSYNRNFEFVTEPVDFGIHSEKEFLQYCLGATLYMPATQNITAKVIDKTIPDITSMVMCFEDAIQESDLSSAQDNVLDHLKAISQAVDQEKIRIDDVPLTFLRVRNPEQFIKFSSRLDEVNIRCLAGFVFPKFSSLNGSQYLSCLYSINQKFDASLYCMPLLEGRSVAFKETRENELKAIKNLLAPFSDQVLNLRIGGTDLSSIFGVRRGINSSIYDILTVRDCLTDILNFFSRVEDNYVISGPVWEYFLAQSGDNIDRMLEDNIHKSLMNRNQIINEAVDGLLREVVLDKANGFVGKTIIHPSHAKFVNAMQAVTKEEYNDARQILETSGGVVKSSKSNKMNEINPHRSWAQRIIHLARAYGVIEDDLSYLRLILG